MIYQDQLNRSIELKEIPKRIISLVPSQTEFLYDLGLDQEVLGITKFCIYPKKWKSSKTLIGGTKNVDIKKVKSFNPDLIIGNKEENTLSEIQELEKIAPVWMSDIFNLEDAYKMMLSIGEMCGKTQKAEEIVSEIQLNFSIFKKIQGQQKVLYLIWNEPMMSVGKNTFIDSLISEFGLQNYHTEQERYPILEQIISENLDFIFLSSEPFPFKYKHLTDFQKRFPKVKAVLVSGEMFSWYGSRLKLTPNYFEELKSQLLNR